MGKLFNQAIQKESLLASYHLIREKWHDPSMQAFKSSSPGIDGMEFAEFEKNLEEQLEHCRQLLLHPDRDFYPQILSLVPKDEPGKFREIYLLTLRDKVVHKALADCIAAALEKRFYPNLFSYRKGKHYGSIAAARRVRKLLEAHQGRLFIFKADVSDYFDNIHQGLLLDKFAKLFPEDPEILRWLEKFVRQRRCERGVVYSPILGIPTGSGLSPVCANLYLCDLDREMFRNNFHYLRYGDDLLLLDPSKERLLEGRDRITQVLARHRLRLSAKKTLIHSPGEPFDYLGYLFADGKIHIGNLSIQRFQKWVDEILPSTRYRDYPKRSQWDRRELLKKILLDFNTGMAATLNLRQLPWIRGFPVVNDDSSFREMDRFIKNRVRRAILGKDSPKNYQRLPEAWFRELGFKSLTGAYHRIIRRRSLAPYRGWRRYFGTNFEAFLEAPKEKRGLKNRLKKLRGQINFVRRAMKGETS